MPIKCPECQEVMKEVRTSSHYGIPIVIDQCEKCGGLWFDDNELYRTKLGLAHEIEDRLDVKKLRKFSDLEKREPICPKDDAKLKVLEDRFFPLSAKVEICPKCNGFWFNHGEFIDFQDKRTGKLKEIEAQRIKKRKDQELDKKLNKKVTSIMQLYHQLGEEKRSQKEVENIKTIFYILWMLLKMLLVKK